MKLSRRKFLRNSSLSLAGTMILPKNIFKVNPINRPTGAYIMGLQLYSVRDDMKNDPGATLKKLSAMGYKNVEHANYIDRKFYGYSPVEFKKLLEGLDLKMPSGHCVMSADDYDTTKKDFTDKWKQTIEDAATVGQMYLISPWLDESLRKNYDDLVGFLEIFNKCGELCERSGLKFGYHNHDFEFKYSLNGKKIYDIILEKTDPKLVIQQMDIGNMYGAGGRPIELLKKYPGRFESMHVKDEIKSIDKGEFGDNYESTILGKGILPVKEIIDLAKRKGGTTEFIIEQESYQDKTPIECAEEDLKAMKNWDF